MSEDLEKVREGDVERSTADEIERKRDDAEGEDDFEGHRHVAQTTEKHAEKFTEKHAE